MVQRRMQSLDGLREDTGCRRLRGKGHLSKVSRFGHPRVATKVPGVSVLLALLSSVLWGTADFLGGTATRRLPALTVVGASQAVALLSVLPVALAVGAQPQHPWSGAVAGIVGVVALGSFYAALAGGTMSVVAPIAALGAGVPVAVGLARGEAPSALQVAGIVVAIVGVVLASGPELSGGASPRPLLLAVVAALGFGLVAVLLADGAKGSSGSVFVTLLIMRATSVTALVVAWLARQVARREVTRESTHFAHAHQGATAGLGGLVASRDLLLLSVIGLGDIGANACFGIASRHGLLSVVSVLASLYPVVTIALARQVHAERIRPIQVLGTLGTLGGVALLVAG